MPRRRMTPARKAAIAKWQKAGAQARKGSVPRSRYKSKAELPRLEYGKLTKKLPFSKVKPSRTAVYAKYEDANMSGFMTGYLTKRGMRVKELHKIMVGSTRPTRGHALLEPGASLLTAAARMAGNKPLSSSQPTNPAFYELVGGKKIRGGAPAKVPGGFVPKSEGKWVGGYSFDAKARKRLAGRRIVRTFPSKG